MISASIVLYNNNKKDIETVVGSYSPSEYRKLFIIDNSPLETDISYLCEFSNIEYCFLGKNIGYGAAHNIAIKQSIDSRMDYHIVLNPDLQFSQNVITTLSEFMDINQNVVYVLPKVINYDGTIQHLCKLLPSPADLIFRRFLPKNKITRKMDERYTLSVSGYDKIIDPPCLSGCFMFLRVSTLEKYSLFFDERFFMYCEDFDLIRRCHRYGKTIFFPYVSIIHNHARQSYKNRKQLLSHIRSAIKYFNKYGWVADHERRVMNKQILYEIQQNKEPAFWKNSSV